MAITKQAMIEDALDRMDTFFNAEFNDQDPTKFSPTVTISNSTAKLNKIMSGGAITSGAITANGGVTWHTPTEYAIQQEYEQRRDIFKKVKDKDIIDIGINANVACITFGDYSVLEVSTKFEWMTLHESTDLISLNGSKLRDIVMHLHHSKMTDVFAQIQIMSTWGNSVVIEISSQKAAVPTDHFLDFSYIEQPTNAVRKQTQTI